MFRKLIKLNTRTVGAVYCSYINKADFRSKNNLNVFKGGWGETHGKTWLAPECKHLKTANSWGKTQEWLEHRHSYITKQYLTEVRNTGTREEFPSAHTTRHKGRVQVYSKAGWSYWNIIFILDSNNLTWVFLLMWNV